MSCLFVLLNKAPRILHIRRTYVSHVLREGLVLDLFRFVWGGFVPALEKICLISTSLGSIDEFLFR